MHLKPKGKENQPIQPKKQFQSKNKSGGPTVMHLNLSRFKISKCEKTQPHDVKRCPFWHFESERRRPLEKYYYSKILCKSRADCGSLDCQYSHNFIEQIYHPDNYKKVRIGCNFRNFARISLSRASVSTASTAHWRTATWSSRSSRCIYSL